LFVYQLVGLVGIIIKSMFYRLVGAQVGALNSICELVYCKVLKYSLARLLG
jgi:hypothetical protein